MVFDDISVSMLLLCHVRPQLHGLRQQLFHSLRQQDWKWNEEEEGELSLKKGPWKLVFPLHW